MFLTGNETAAFLGISRRSLYRWVKEKRLSVTDWTPERLAVLELTPRPRGPKRNPNSRRYVYGRHSFSRKASGQASATAGGMG